MDNLQLALESRSKMPTIAYSYVLALLALAAATAILQVESQELPLVPHLPISITSDDGFLLPTNGVVGGSGTPEDPYGIAGWDIRKTGAIETAIRIEYVTKHVVLQNISVAGDEEFSAGIVVNSTANVKMMDVDVTARNALDLQADAFELQRSAFAGQQRFRGGTSLVMVENALAGSLPSVEGVELVRIERNTVEGPINLPGLEIHGAHQVTIRDLALEAGLSIWSANETVLENLTMDIGGSWMLGLLDHSESSHWNNVHVTGGQAWIGSSSGPHVAHVQNSVFRDSGYGLAVQASDVTLQDVQFLRHRQAAIAVQDSTLSLSGVLMEGNRLAIMGKSNGTVQSIGTTFLDNGVAIQGTGMHNSRIVGGTMTGPEGIQIGSSRNVTVTNVTIGAERGISVTGEGVEISGNSISGCSDCIQARADGLLVINNTLTGDSLLGTGIHATNSSNILIQANTYGYGEQGIVVQDSGSNVTIVGNSIHDVSYAGISVSGRGGNVTDNVIARAHLGISSSGAAILRGNNVTGARGAGILLAPGTSRGTVVANHVWENPGWGIALYGVGTDVVTDSTIAGNLVNMNPNGGIYIHGRRNTITNNTIHDNQGWGIYSVHGSENVIHGNAFAGNGLDRGQGPALDLTTTSNTTTSPSMPDPSKPAPSVPSGLVALGLLLVAIGRRRRESCPTGPSASARRLPMPARPLPSRP